MQQLSQGLPSPLLLRGNRSGGVRVERPDLTTALAVDARLTEIERALNLLLNVTPTNGAEAWRDFERSGFESVPTLQSRPLDFDPDLVKRDLYNVEIERVEDPALNSLFRAKRDEIARQITLLEDRGTSRFRYGALAALRRTRGIADRDGSLAARAYRSATDHGAQHHRNGIRRRGTSGARVDTDRVIRASPSRSRCATTWPI